MRYLSLLLLSIVISSFVLGAAEGLCPRLRYVDTVEWLGADDLGFDLGMPELNDDEAEDLNVAEPGKNDSKIDDSLNATGEDVVDDAGVVEETATESGALDEVDLTLVGDVTGNVDLALFRSGDVVFGTGSLTAGGVKSQVGASGSATGDKLLLHLVPLDGSRLYVLNLNIEEGAIRGSYEAIGSDGQLLSGRADNTFFA
jgi:hypothetical protein